MTPQQLFSSGSNHLTKCQVEGPLLGWASIQEHSGMAEQRAGPGNADWGTAQAAQPQTATAAEQYLGSPDLTAPTSNFRLCPHQSLTTLHLLLV